MLLGHILGHYTLKFSKKHFRDPLSQFPDFNEIRTLLTSLYFSKLYYGSEIWHTFGLKLELQKNLKYASANALKLCIPRSDSYMTHTEIHRLARRALPDQMCKYKHALSLYKLFNHQCPETEFVNLNFQLCDNARSTKLIFTKRESFEVGKNILLNRLHKLNNLIEKEWLNLTFNTYKVKCKELFLT